MAPDWGLRQFRRIRRAVDRSNTRAKRWHGRRQGRLALSSRLAAHGRTPMHGRIPKSH